MDNRISFSLSEAEKQEISAAIKVLKDKLLPKLVELTPGEARELPLMGDKSYAFVIKALEYARQYPEFAGLVNVPEFETDVKTVETLRELFVPLSQITKKVSDTMTLAGSEAYVSGLTYYGSSKEGLKRTMADAELIVRELKQRFPGRNKPKQAE
jgi:ribonuclease D